jgi:hypothetical protein
MGMGQDNLQGIAKEVCRWNSSVANEIAQLLQSHEASLESFHDAVLSQSHDELRKHPESLDTDNERDDMNKSRRALSENGLRLNRYRIQMPTQVAERLAANVANFNPLGDDGKLLEDKHRRRIDTVLQRAFNRVSRSAQKQVLVLAASDQSALQIPNAVKYHTPDYLIERLRTTMLNRWRRILYQRSPHFADFRATEPVLPKWIDETKLCEYVCIYEHCSKPNQTYETSEILVEHFKAEHAQNLWACGECPHLEAFTDPGDYKQHLMEHFRGSSEERVKFVDDLPAAVHFLRQRVPYEVACCLFCGFQPNIMQEHISANKLQEEIRNHMMKHMKSLAYSGLM